MTHTPALQAEHELAVALGWTSIQDAGGSLIGTPPYDAANSRGQAAVPRWARDWSACGPLMIEQRLVWRVGGSFVFAGTDSTAPLCITPLSSHADLEAAVRYAITKAATVQLAFRGQLAGIDLNLPSTMPGN